MYISKHKANIKSFKHCLEYENYAFRELYKWNILADINLKYLSYLPL